MHLTENGTIIFVEDEDDVKVFFIPGYCPVKEIRNAKKFFICSVYGKTHDGFFISCSGETVFINMGFLFMSDGIYIVAIPEERREEFRKRTTKMFNDLIKDFSGKGFTKFFFELVRLLRDIETPKGVTYGIQEKIDMLLSEYITKSVKAWDDLQEAVRMVFSGYMSEDCAKFVERLLRKGIPVTLSLDGGWLITRTQKLGNGRVK